MNWKNMLVSGAITGVLLAVFIIFVFVLAEIDPGSEVGLCGGFFLLIAVSAVLANQISKRAKWPEVSLKILIPVACFTSVMPLFGTLFGMPNSEPNILAIVVAMGAIGGFFWSIPFAIWSFYSSGKTNEKE